MARSKQHALLCLLLQCQCGRGAGSCRSSSGHVQLVAPGSLPVANPCCMPWNPNVTCF